MIVSKAILGRFFIISGVIWSYPGDFFGLILCLTICLNSSRSISTGSKYSRISWITGRENSLFWGFGLKTSDK